MRKRQLCMICLPLLLFLIFAGTRGGGTPDEASRPWLSGEEIRVQGTVYRQESKENGQTIYLKNISVLSKASQHIEAVSEYEKKRILVYLKEKTELEIGNQVQVGGTCAYFSVPENPGGFDAYGYYSAMNIGMALKKAAVLKRSRDVEYLAQMLSGIRSGMANGLAKVFSAEDTGVLQAMLLGDRTGLDKELRDLYQEGGIIHILAISGLHISILGMGLYRLLRKMRLSFGGAALVSGSLLILYAVMTGGAYSSVRAVFMFVIFLGAQVTGRTYDLLTALMCAAVWLLLGNPKIIGQAGFLLSFAAVLGVQVSSAADYPLFKIKGLGVSAAVWLVTLPLVSWFYYRVPVYGIFLNLLVLPLMPFVLVSGIAAGLSGFMAGILAGTAGMAMGMYGAAAGAAGTAGRCAAAAGTFLAAPAHYILQFLRFLCEAVRMLPGSTLVVGRPGIVQIVVYYLFLLIFLLFFKKKRKIDLLTGAFGIILMVSIVLYREPQKWTMTFLNVGQGDGCCIRTEERQVFLIDGGSSDHTGLLAYTLQPYLEYHGIDRVDYWMVSHYDTDHISGLLEVLEGYQRNLAGENACGITVRNIVLPDTEENRNLPGASGNEVREKLLALATKNEISIRYAGAGDAFRQGDTVFRILAPDRETAYENENASSMVVEVAYDGFRALLTGDVEGSGEKALLKSGILEKADVLKVAHHGSQNSTSRDFLEKIMPEVAVISCGDGNRYGHPHEELLDRLAEKGRRILRTDRTGAVDIVVDGGDYRVTAAE